MNTRMQLWKSYRDNIEKNASLQKAVKESNEKLKILHSRLINVFPEYDQKYKSNLSKFEATISKVEQAPSIPSDNIEKLIENINKLENENDSSFAAIDKIDFASDELKGTIKIIKSGKINKVNYIETNLSDMQVSKTKIIELGEKMEKHRIAIDGPSGSGKSTVAKKIASKYNLKYINTGLVYRAIAYKLIQDEINVNDERAVESSLPGINIKLLRNEIVELNGVEITKELRSDEVSQTASVVASYSKVRIFAVNIQKIEGTRNGVVMDGRDTTFKIMPNADVKIFLDTSPEVRARRRQEQNQELGYSTDYNTILKEIQIRDERDRTRETDPLHITKGAHLIDASDMTIDQVVDTIVNIIEK